jgi:hypothetical protein
MSLGTMKPSFGRLSGQKFAPSTMALKFMSMLLSLSSIRSLKESVKSLLSLMSTILVSNCFAFTTEKEYTCEHSLELVRVFDTASLFQLGDHA